MDHLHTKAYRNDFVTTFPGDQSGDLSPRQTPGVLYSKALPTPVKEPRLLAWSADLAEQLGISAPAAEDVNILGGNLVTPSMQPYAACYAGHQFGSWAGQLGDGRAITLGEWTAPDGQPWELQLKGAGPTPYSRRADGRAVLRSSVREYLMSEAMHHLGVPTTRALGLVTTGDPVLRDMFYDGHPAFEPGAIVMRVAPSFLRFGNFEMPAARRETANLERLTDWTIARFFPHLQGKDRVLLWFQEVVERTAALMVEWLRVGFVHGVMNTDNMSILGLTIDYGPYSFLDDYDPSFTPNTTDLPGRRYAFGRQPSIGLWNLGCLAGAVSALLPGTDELEAILDGYQEVLLEKYYLMMANKLGLNELLEEDNELFANFERVLSTLKPDMTIFYQLLTDLPPDLSTEEQVGTHFAPSFYKEPDAAGRAALFQLVREYGERLLLNTCSREESVLHMRKANPRFILRNYLLSQAIEELEKGSDVLFRQLQEALRDPYSRRFDQFFAKRPEWATSKAGCSMLSCSS
ncbi:YdiU family protein [Paraflavisolibacter sp. H34]|uniref:protein adenylyltransferase SelO n=1 Tax=Huijunlia imazamoxiresistens TaxID=3127457 RepID=UPI003016396D